MWGYVEGRPGWWWRGGRGDRETSMAFGWILGFCATAMGVGWVVFKTVEKEKAGSYGL